MLDNALEHAGAIILLGFGGMGLLLFAVVVVGSMFGANVSGETFDLLKLIITSSLSLASGAGLTLSAQRVQASKDTRE